MAEIIGKITPPTEIKVKISSTGAKGDDGFSPSIRIEDIENGHKVIIVDSDGEKTFDVMDGSISESDIDRIIQIVEDAIEPTLDEKQDLLVSGQNIKTVNGESIIGSGDIEVAKQSDIPTKTSDLENDDGFITDVQVNGVSIVSDGIASIPKSTTDSWGLFKPISGGHGIYSDSNGSYIRKADNSQIDARTNQYMPIVSSNLDYAVKQAMCDGKGAEWSDDEKANAKERIGISNASDTVSGLVKIDSYYGIAIAQSGKLYLNTISKSDYSTSNNAVFISKGTLDNVLSDKIKVNDIKLNNTSIVSDGVASIPFADNNRNSHGVVSVNSDSGLFVQNGYMTVDPASADGLSNLRSNLSYRRPIVPYNLDLAVKVAMCDGKGNSWTTEEKLGALARLGVTVEDAKVVLADGTETIKKILVMDV